MFNKKSEVEIKLAAVLAKADEVLNERSKIEATIQKAAAEKTAAEANLQKALERLAVEESGRGVGRYQGRIASDSSAARSG